ncbi:MAG: ChaN family lipoprotein [Marinobacter sp.]|nr:ChaN family lipoprotein [Marinobacter sp.]
MNCLTRFFLMTLAASIAGCASSPASRPTSPEPLASLLDTTLISAADHTVLTLPELVRRLKDVDVVVMGEYHGHNGAHLLEARLQQALYEQRPEQILSLEQFNVDHQADLDHYLNGRIGEAAMREDAEAWPNYAGSYRPLVEFARRHGLPVVAANAAARTVHCVGQQGPAYLETLTGDARTTIPDQPFYGSAAYRDKFMGAMGGSGHGASHSVAIENSYLAQLLRDNTMAERILQAHRQHPGYQILHLTGAFHSEGFLGTVAALQARAPDLRVQVITPVFTAADGTIEYGPTDRQRGNVLYYLLPLPEEYRDEARARKAMRAQFSRKKPLDCRPAAESDADRNRP